MLERLYRGKLKADNGEHKKGEWVKGYYVKLTDGNIEHHHIYGAGEVDPDTLGQETGFSDESGTKIVEGDILIVNNDDRYRYVAIFQNGKYTLFCEKQNWLLLDSYKTKIIGNIYDNPELADWGDT